MNLVTLQYLVENLDLRLKDVFLMPPDNSVVENN